MIPPKPEPRPDRVSLWRYWRMFRRDILSAQPARLYRARMAEFRTPFFRSFLVNEPDLVRRVLKDRAADFPKSDRVTRGLRPLLGRSVFVTNGAEWARARRIIDPAFEEGGRLRDTFPAMVDASRAAVARLETGRLDVEAWASHATADVIFRTLFSLPIEDRLAKRTYDAFREFQRAQPVAIGAALLPWLPVWHGRRARNAAAELRALIGELVANRRVEISAGKAPDDLATRIMTRPDPESGTCFDTEEMVDQVAIFFLAGHETSASALGWALWCLAAAPSWAERAREEALVFWDAPSFGDLARMPVTRDVIREVLRLYPPVPMFVREAAGPEEFRGRKLHRGDQVVISPWHLQRHERLWERPDVFDPARWQTEAGRASSREAYLPFSTGPRVCPGAGFAMAEAAVLLSGALARARFSPAELPVPVAHLTVRSKDGIFLKVEPVQRSASR